MGLIRYYLNIIINGKQANIFLIHFATVDGDYMKIKLE
jgi:hypothetical protein